MNKTIAICLLLFLVFLGGISLAQQPKKKESYKSLRDRSSASAVTRLLQEANELKSEDAAGALNRLEEALAMSIAQQDNFNEAKCYLLMGQINENISEWKLALENYFHAYQKLSISYTESAEYRQILRGLGDMNLKLSFYDEALKYYQEALSFDLDKNEKTAFKLSISEVKYQQGKYDEALKILDEIPSSKIEDQDRATQIQNQRAKIYARMNNFSKTKEIYQSTVNTLKSSSAPNQQTTQSLQTTKEEISDALISQNRYDDEIDLRKQSVEYNTQSNNLAEVAKDKVAISKSLEAKGDNNAALKELEEAVQIANSLSNPKDQANAFLSLAGAYEKNGKSYQALEAYRKYSEAISLNEKQEEIRFIEKSELIRKQNDIEEHSKEVYIAQGEDNLAQATVGRQQLIIYGLVLIIVIIGITSYFIYKNAQASKIANQMLALKSLRSQMNPHFIFNALNSVNHFIAQQDERSANRFLSEFSQLMRLVLENSQEDFIPLQKEQEILSLYLKLEHYRFRDKFDYHIETDKMLDTENIIVPPMLIQPYIENSVWHGLRYKETMGKLIMRFKRHQDNLLVEVIDDGIGRKRSAELKTENQKKHNSTGLKNIGERLSIINKVYHWNCRVTVDDLAGDAGTHVKIYLPINLAKQKSE